MQLKTHEDKQNQTNPGYCCSLIVPLVLGHFEGRAGHHPPIYPDGEEEATSPP